MAGRFGSPLAGIGNLVDRLQEVVRAFDKTNGHSHDGTMDQGPILSGANYVYNVKAYGAKGDGATDDTAAIQAAIDAAEAAGGGIVFLPPGTYVCGSGLTIDDDDVRVIGAGGSAASYLYFNGTASADGITIASTANRCSVEHLHLADLGTGGHGIVINGNRIKLDDLYINSWGNGAGVKVNAGAFLITMTDVESLENSDGFSINPTTASPAVDALLMLRCYAHNNTAAGFVLRGCWGTVIEANADSNAQGFRVSTAFIELSGCMESNTSYGLLIEGSGYVTVTQMRANGEAIPYYINGAANVTMLNLRSTGTTGTYSLTATASATGELILMNTSHLDKAMSINAAAALRRFTAWTDWTPTVTQSGSVAVTVVEAKYSIVGQLCHIYAKVTVNTGATGTAGNAIIVGGIPTAAQAAVTDLPAGEAQIYDIGTATYYGIVRIASASTVDFSDTVTRTAIGNNPSFGLAETDVIRFSATWRVA